MDYRLRITFGKTGAMKYIGHLDLAKTWERILRRAQIDLAYTQGFNARPKMQLAAPLPLGMTSGCELMDVWLAGGEAETAPVHREADLAALAGRLTAVSPPGLPILQITAVPLRSPALQMLAERAVYHITLSPIDFGDLQQRIDALMAQPTILRTRKDKPYNLKPLINRLSVDTQGALIADLVVTPQGAAGRPDEVIAALGLQEHGRVAYHRAHLGLRPLNAEGGDPPGAEMFDTAAEDVAEPETSDSD
jgi:radical SAM-linked protein